jgi:hypothetical protein
MDRTLILPKIDKLITQYSYLFGLQTFVNSKNYVTFAASRNNSVKEFNVLVIDWCYVLKKYLKGDEQLSQYEIEVLAAKYASIRHPLYAVVVDIRSKVFYEPKNVTIRNLETLNYIYKNIISVPRIIRVKLYTLMVDDLKMIGVVHSAVEWEVSGKKSLISVEDFDVGNRW